ncbi:hypothetical protein C4565_08085 [Candidatus Parcubacteria bacterium]|nr:MAG: hypothetical protein C4565_08085 [Candidatus Parcubacteria bacterium]
MNPLENLNTAQISSWAGHSANIVQNNSLDQGYCLFRFLNEGFCNSSLFNSTSYLDLGGALAAFGLIFTVYQLRNPIWDTVLSIRPTWQRYSFWAFGIIGLLLVLARVLITQIPINYLSYPFDVPIAYEILAYIFFALSPLSLWFFAKRQRGLFTEKTSRRFYEVLISEVSRSDEKWTDASLEVLLHNFKDICKSTKENKIDSEISQNARAIIDVVLSEESVVKVLTTKRLDALQHILFMVEKYDIDQRLCNVGIPAIVRNLFLDECSFFYKHLNRDGLALSSNIYRSIFESPKLLINFSLFGYPTLGYSARKNSRISTSVTIEALSKAISTYIKTGQGSVRHINEGFEYLSNTFENVCRKIAIEEGRGVDIRYAMEEEWWTLHDIAQFLGHTYPFLDYQESLNQEVIDREKTTSEASFHSGSTINAGVAALLYKAFEGLSHIKKNTDVHLILHQLLEGMLYQENYKEGYKNPFEKRTWEQIAKNVTQRYYPATLRTYLASLIYYLNGKEIGTGTGWAVQQAERMRRLLYIDLKPLLDKEEKMANDELMKDVLLPDQLDYKDGKFIYTLGFGKGSKTTIVEPPPESKSALEGIDLEHQSLL